MHAPTLREAPGWRLGTIMAGIGSLGLLGAWGEGVDE